MAMFYYNIIYIFVLKLSPVQPYSTESWPKANHFLKLNRGGYGDYNTNVEVRVIQASQEDGNIQFLKDAYVLQ